ncbi:hypothetical protein D3C86_1096010 [compost metagenome]
MQRRDHVGRRGEAPLTGLGHVAVLVVKVHRQRMRVAGGAGQGFFTGEDEAHARYAFQAFAGSGDQCIERYLLSVDGQGAERTHGVDDQAFAVLRNDVGNFRQRVEDAGAGFAVDQRNVSDAGISAQQTIDVGGGGRFVFGGFESAERAAQHFANLRQAFAVGAVDQHQHLAIARHQCADCRLDSEGAAALQRHAVVSGGAVEDRQQLFAEAGGQLVEAVIP